MTALGLNAGWYHTYLSRSREGPLTRRSWRGPYAAMGVVCCTRLIASGLTLPANARNAALMFRRRGADPDCPLSRAQGSASATVSRHFHHRLPSSGLVGGACGSRRLPITDRRGVGSRIDRRQCRCDERASVRAVNVAGGRAERRNAGWAGPPAHAFVRTDRNALRQRRCGREQSHRPRRHGQETHGSGLHLAKRRNSNSGNWRADRGWRRWVEASGMVETLARS